MWTWDLEIQTVVVIFIEKKTPTINLEILIPFVLYLVVVCRPIVQKTRHDERRCPLHIRMRIKLRKKLLPETWISEKSEARSRKSHVNTPRFSWTSIGMMWLFAVPQNALAVWVAELSNLWIGHYWPSWMAGDQIDPLQIGLCRLVLPGKLPASPDLAISLIQNPRRTLHPSSPESQSLW